MMLTNAILEALYWTQSGNMHYERMQTDRLILLTKGTASLV
jgi:hypothetical protein